MQLSMVSRITPRAIACSRRYGPRRNLSRQFPAALRRFRSLELHIAVPCDAAFHGIAHYPARNRMLAKVRAAQELVAPVPGGAAALRIFLGQCIAIPFAAVVGADLQRPVHPRLE